MAHDNQQAAWLSDLLARHGRALTLYARQWTDWPEDVVQDVLLQLFTLSKRPENGAAWLFRAVRNAAISDGRSARRRQQRERRSAAGEAWFDDASQALDAATATAAIGKLPEELREVMIARIWGELTFAEIAELTETSTSTAQRRYEQALRTLQQQLAGPCTTNNH